MPDPINPTTSVLTADERRIMTRYAQHGVPDIHVPESASDFHPFVGDTIFLKPLRFDVRNSLYVTVFWSKAQGRLGRHRHRGPVTGYTLQGSWHYEEYDWVSRTGDIVHENPGVIHTLCSDEGMKTLFFVQGPLEFYDEHDALIETMDVFTFLDMYIRHCEATGVPVNEKLIY